MSSTKFLESQLKVYCVLLHHHFVYCSMHFIIGSLFIMALDAFESFTKNNAARVLIAAEASRKKRLFIWVERIVELKECSIQRTMETFTQKLWIGFLGKEALDKLSLDNLFLLPLIDLKKSILKIRSIQQARAGARHKKRDYLRH